MQRTLHRARNESFPSEQLAAIRDLRVQLDQLEREVVLRMRAAGYSWEDIARPMGITRQALQKKAHTWQTTEPS